MDPCLKPTRAMSTGGVMSEHHGLVETLRRHRKSMAPVLPLELRGARSSVLDFSATNPKMEHINPDDTEAFSAHVARVLERNQASYGIGRYNEDRVIYRHSSLFAGEQEARSVHLGIDIFAPPGLAVHAALPATVHSLADNARKGNYGPTVILEHVIDDICFHTLYGHLSRSSLPRLSPGRTLAKGDPVGFIGADHENGHWPPHLHFQIIADLGEHVGDFPGVASPSERNRYLSLCPDPDIILGLLGKE
jgi:murein DD-endopeptidase MepM/ murein hydrolase activator NlpD